MWQADFKGYIKMRNGKRCHPLTLLDDHSRYSLCVDAKEDEKYLGTQESFKQIFEMYGLPETLLCDNGNPWGTSQSAGYTRFEVWLMELGILTKHGRIRHPQTQGKEERFNGTLKKELLKFREFEDIVDAQKSFNEYRNFYNNERPHHALGLETPSTRYRSSGRKYSDKITEWIYKSDVKVRQLKNSGYMTFEGQGYFLSEALGGKTVGLIESKSTDGMFYVLYREFCIAKLDLKERIIISRRARRWVDG